MQKSLSILVLSAALAVTSLGAGPAWRAVDGSWHGPWRLADAGGAVSPAARPLRTARAEASAAPTAIALDRDVASECLASAAPGPGALAALDGDDARAATVPASLAQPEIPAGAHDAHARVDGRAEGPVRLAAGRALRNFVVARNARARDSALAAAAAE